MQELPGDRHQAHKDLRGVPYTTHRDHNTVKTRPVKAFKEVYTDLSTYAYGSLSHCTLCLGLLSMKHGAVWDISPNTKAAGWRSSKQARTVRGTW